MWIHSSEAPAAPVGVSSCRPGRTHHGSDHTFVPEQQCELNFDPVGDFIFFCDCWAVCEDALTEERKCGTEKRK